MHHEDEWQRGMGIKRRLLRKTKRPETIREERELEDQEGLVQIDKSDNDSDQSHYKRPRRFRNIQALNGLTL